VFKGLMKMHHGWNYNDKKKSKCSGKRPVCETLSTTHPTWPAFATKPDVRGEGPETSHLRHEMASKA